jgi:hypothetical protein
MYNFIKPPALKQMNRPAADLARRSFSESGSCPMLQRVPFDHKKYSILKNQLFPPAGETPLEAAAKNNQYSIIK